LVDSPGWAWLTGIYTEQKEARLTDIVLRPPEGQDSLIQKEYAIGEVAGMKLITQLPVIALEQVNEEIELLIKEVKEDEDDDGKRSDTLDYPIG
jgi:hypothetical protein